MTEPRELIEKSDIYAAAHRGIDRIHPLSPAEWEAVRPHMRFLPTRRGQLLQEAGEEAASTYFIVSGMVRLYYITPDGKELNKAFYAEDQLVGALSAIILGEPSRFRIETLEPCSLVEIPNRVYRETAMAHPGWDALFNRCCQLQLIRNERREAELLTCTARERFLQFTRNFPGHLARIPQYHIASYLGITPVALSKYKKQWLSQE